jgi:hypothetical protein
MQFLRFLRAVAQLSGTNYTVCNTCSTKDERYKVCNVRAEHGFRCHQHFTFVTIPTLVVAQHAESSFSLARCYYPLTPTACGPLLIPLEREVFSVAPMMGHTQSALPFVLSPAKQTSTSVYRNDTSVSDCLIYTEFES